MSNLIHTSASEFVRATILIAEATGKQPRHYSTSTWIGNMRIAVEGRSLRATTRGQRLTRAQVLQLAAA